MYALRLAFLFPEFIAPLHSGRSLGSQELSSGLDLHHLRAQLPSRACSKQENQFDRAEAEGEAHDDSVVRQIYLLGR